MFPRDFISSCILLWISTFLFFFQMLTLTYQKILTGLYQSHIQNFVDLRIVGRDVKNTFWRVLNASDVDWYQILAYLLPFYSSSTTC